MVPVNQKIIKFHVNSLLLDAHKWTSIAYVYKNIENAFEKSFTVSIESLHDYLFETITILVKRDHKVLSGIRISIKDLKSMEYTGVPLMMLESMELSSFLSSPYNAVGFVSFTLVIENTSLKFKESRQRLPNVLLNTVFNRFMSDFVARIFNLAFVIQEGKLKHKIRALLGFMATQILGSKLFHSCSGSHELECQDADCFGRYGGLSVKKAKQGLKALHYSAIAYSNAPFPIFAPKRLRRVRNADPIKAHILSHAEINEADILKVYAGSLNSAAFTAFFDCNKLVVSFRGTCTANELLNALDSRYVPFLDGFAHSGMLRLAKRFLSDEWAGFRNAMKRKKCKSVLFTGHSLGGAVATMVYLILKGHGSFLDDVCLDKSDARKIHAKVLAFSVPPCVSKNIALKNFPGIVVFNYERDTIPQLSFGSILDLKYLCLSIILRKVLHCVFFYRRSQMVAEINQVRAFLRDSNVHEKLFCPGTIYHIRAVHVGGRMVYRYRIVSPEFYGEIKHYMNSLLSHIMVRISHAFEHTIHGE